VLGGKKKSDEGREGSLSICLESGGLQGSKEIGSGFRLLERFGEEDREGEQTEGGKVHVREGEGGGSFYKLL